MVRGVNNQIARGKLEIIAEEYNELMTESKAMLKLLENY